MTARRYTPARPINARPGANHAPTTFYWRGHWERVRAIESTWEVTANWWRGAATATQRRYYRLITRDGLWCVVYQDLVSGDWLLEQVLD